MQDFDTYRKEFLEDTRATEESEANGTVASFVKICALKLFEGDVLPEYTPCFYQGYGYRNAALHVDGYSFDETDGTFYLLVATFSGSAQSEVLLGSDAKTALDRCRAFAQQSIENDLQRRIEISTEAYDLASFIYEQAQYVSKFVVILLTDMTLSERANLSESSDNSKKKSSKKKAGILDADPIHGINVEYRIWDMPRFHRMFASSDGREEIEIDFNDYIDGGIPCLSANLSSQSSECTSFLCIVPGGVLADLYDEYGSRMLEGNVRSFLGNKGSKKSVNNQIRGTIINEPDRFFVYNNGLSATAVDVRVVDGKLIYARDLQIVNGGQTTASLSATRKKDRADLSRVSVLMKLTQVEPASAPEIVPLISKSANSQNKINPADFFSTHEYHVRFEQISRRKFAPAKDGAQHETHWFYERARGQYIQATLRMTKAEEKKFLTQNPKDQLVTKTDLAKVLSAWDGFPHIVSKGAESNFEDFAKRTEVAWEKQKDDFNDVYFQNAIALVILYRTTDKLIPKQPWYTNGYKANIVAYSVALLHHAIKAQFPNDELDLLKIWQKQKCSDELIKQMTIIAEQVYNTITSPDRPIENVTQWCKQERCWEEVKKIRVVFVPGYGAFLCDKGKHQEAKKEARQTRKVENTIDDQTLVFELGEDYWKRLLNWTQTHRVATEAEMRALKYATRMSQGYFPDEKQCRNLINLRDKAIGEGFAKK